MMSDTDYPKRAGYTLTDEGVLLFENYLSRVSDYGCSCHINPPCGTCSHEGHPICIEETPELWVKEVSP
jgi:hypothetical protein